MPLSCDPYEGAVAQAAGVEGGEDCAFAACQAREMRLDRDGVRRKRRSEAGDDDAVGQSGVRGEFRRVRAVHENEPRCRLRRE
jgi:hypothetical protein